MIKKEKEKVGNTLNIGELMTNIKLKKLANNILDSMVNSIEIEEAIIIYGEQCIHNYILNLILEEIHTNIEFQNRFQNNLKGLI